jgi:hypothetical protein
MPVSTFRMLTVALTTAAPLGSVMVPVRIAPTTWARAAVASSKTISVTRAACVRFETPVIELLDRHSSKMAFAACADTEVGTAVGTTSVSCGEPTAPEPITPIFTCLSDPA